MLITAPDSFSPHLTTPQPTPQLFCSFNTYLCKRKVHSSQQQVKCRIQRHFTLLDTALPGRTFWPVTVIFFHLGWNNSSIEPEAKSLEKWMTEFGNSFRKLRVIATKIFTSQSYIFVHNFWYIHHNGIHYQINVHTLIKNIFYYIPMNVFWWFVLSFF